MNACSTTPINNAAHPKIGSQSAEIPTAMTTPPVLAIALPIWGNNSSGYLDLATCEKPITTGTGTKLNAFPPNVNLLRHTGANKQRSYLLVLGKQSATTKAAWS